jgi:hypothetical protein
VSYLLGRRCWIWYHHKKYERWLKNEKEALKSVDDVETGVTLPYERTYVETESVEEREWRVEKAFLDKREQGVEGEPV